MAEFSLTMNAGVADALSLGAAKPVAGQSAKAAAQDFESLLIGLVMKTARESMAGVGGDSDEAGSTMSEFAEQQLAQVMSANGGLGLASMIASSLDKTQAQIDAGHASNSEKTQMPGSGSAALPVR